MTSNHSSAPPFEELALVASALSNPHRLELLEIIVNGEKSVDQLAEAAELSMANASQHLQHLKRAGLVTTRREGKRIYYRAGDGPVREIIASLQSYLSYTHAELLRFVDSSGSSASIADSISREELLDRLLSGDVVLLDVRSSAEFDQGHLPQAKGIPVEALEARLAELPRDKEVVAYCRGPMCLLSEDASRILRSNGFRVKRLAAGYPDWKAAGLSVVEPA